MKSWLQTETVDTAECSAGVFEVMRKKKKKKETKEARNRMRTEDERLCRAEQTPEGDAQKRGSEITS